MIAFTNSEKIAELQKELNAKIVLRDKRQQYLYWLTNECRHFNEKIPEVKAEIRVIQSEIDSLEYEINRLVSENRVVDTEIHFCKQFCLYDKDMD